MFWYLILPRILMIPVCIYLYVIFKRLFGVFFKENKMYLQRGISIILAVFITIPASNIWGVWAVVVLHFAVIAALIDSIRLILKKAGCKTHKVWDMLYRTGAMTAAITLMIIGYAYLNMQYVMVTEYTMSTDKDIQEQGYNIVFLSDLHFGTTMNQERLAEYCKRMEEEKPDLVILGGDIVDESTTLVQIGEVFQTLSKIDSTYGLYYVFGNHDKGRYWEDCDFTEEQLRDAIQKNGIKILEDETDKVNDELYITGRRDRSDTMMTQISREASSKLVENVPQSSFLIMVDHQPRNMDENEAAGYDLMLSGHTHAGQIWPVGLITTLFDKATVNYGEKTIGNMELIVSSGIAGWGYPLRTGKHCEFVVVHLVR